MATGNSSSIDRRIQSRIDVDLFHVGYLVAFSKIQLIVLDENAKWWYKILVVKKTATVTAVKAHANSFAFQFHR